MTHFAMLTMIAMKTHSYCLDIPIALQLTTQHTTTRDYLVGANW